MNTSILNFWAPFFFVTIMFGISEASSARNVESKKGGELRFAKTQKPDSDYRQVWKNSAGAFSGDIFLLPKKGNFFLEDKDFKQGDLYPSSVNGAKIPPHPITMHGFAWGYDLSIPLVFKDGKSEWIKPGQYHGHATQQDITPTLAHLLGLPSPAKKTGRVLKEAIRTNQVSVSRKMPKAIVVFVQDQMGHQYLEAHPGVARFYENFLKTGANFAMAKVSHVDVETSVGHTAVGTGAWPPEHGVSGNDFFHTGLWRQLKAFNIAISNDKKENLIGNPSFLFTPTLGDILLQATEGKGIVYSQVYAPRAAIGMAGHGAMFGKGFKSHAVWIDENGEGTGEDVYTTNEKIYSLPKFLQNNSVKPYLDKFLRSTSGVWKGHSFLDDKGSVDYSMVKTSPAATEWEGDLALGVIKELGIGTDDVTDLVYINTKATDACGHRFGFESEECREVLAMTDQVSEKIFNALQTVTNGDFIAILTADHGAAPLPEVSGATRFSRQKLIKDLNEKFDRLDNKIPSILSLTSSQIYLNRSELQLNGFKVSEIVSFLKKYEVPFEAPYNVLADEWIKRGKSKRQLFFQDVVAKDDLK
ncbi:MAG: alkaline phosphatase family protein [Proteobacteria bacterium]|nr:alkaline phosphatase family protein [Pseudomonadota bacterium]